MTKFRRNVVRFAEVLFRWWSYQPCEHFLERIVGVSRKASMHRPWLDDGVADVGEPVEPLADIELGNRAAGRICRGDLDIGFQVASDHVDVNIIRKCVQTIPINEVFHFEESLRTAEKHEADIEALATLDIWYQPQHTVQVGNWLTHVAGPGWPDPDRSHQRWRLPGIARLLQ